MRSCSLFILSIATMLWSIPSSIAFVVTPAIGSMSKTTSSSLCLTINHSWKPKSTSLAVRTTGSTGDALSPTIDATNNVIHPIKNILQSFMIKSLVGTMTVLSLTIAPINALVPTNFMIVPPANAAESSRTIGQIKGSGLLFKDTLQIEAFPDPKVKGVNLYISNFQIPLTERLGTGNFFSDPSYASVACSRSKQVAIADNIAKGPAGEEVFEESKSLLFKTLRVQRIYDEETKTVVYVSFNTRLDKNDDSNKSRFKSSVCAINLE